MPKKVLPQDTRSTARKVAEHVAGNVWKDLESRKEPLNEVAARKTNELGAMMSKMGSDAYGFCIPLQQAAWSPLPAAQGGSTTHYSVDPLLLETLTLTNAPSSLVQTSRKRHIPPMQPCLGDVTTTPEISI